MILKDDHVHVVFINLESATDRLESMSQQLEGYTKDFTWERFEAVYGKDMSDEEKKAVTTPNCYKYCTDSMIGIGKSHLDIWKKQVEERIPFVLVFEDDVEIVPTFEEIVKNYIVDFDFDVLMVGHDGMIELPYIFNLPESLMRGNGFNYNAKVPYNGTHAYVISLDGAKRLLEEFKDGISYHIDMAISQRDIKIVKAPNAIARPAYGKFDSSNTGKSILMYLVPDINIGPYPLHWAMEMPVMRIGSFDVLHIHVQFVLLMILLLGALLIFSLIKQKAAAGVKRQ